MQPLKNSSVQDPWHFSADPDPAPAPDPSFVSDNKDMEQKIYIFFFYLLKVHYSILQR